MIEVCDLHKLRECKRCPERPENNSLTGSAVYGLDQSDPVSYFNMLADETEIWDGTDTNIKPCLPIPCGADE